MDARLAERDSPDQGESADPYEMANLYPKTTGLPMTVWAGPKAGARHDARVKVSKVHGDRMDPHDLAVVAVRPQPRVVKGALSSADEAAVGRWIELNQAILLEFWDGAVDTADFITGLRRLDP